MEETDLEVKGLHDELLEERARESQLAQRIALLTAILSTIGAVFSFQSNNTGVEAEVLKSSSIAKVTQASDQWAYYQAKATREYLSNTAAIQTDDFHKKQSFLADAKRYEAEKEEIRQEALKLEKEAIILDAEAAATLRPHHRMTLAMVFVQIAIALALITALTRKRWLLAGAMGSALLAMATAISGVIR